MLGDDASASQQVSAILMPVQNALAIQEALATTEALMFFLLRLGFWFSLVLLCLPFGGDGETRSVGPLEALMAARGAVADISGICDRQPHVCDTGSAAFHTVAVRARETARIAYQTLGEEDGDSRGTNGELEDQPTDTLTARMYPDVQSIVTGSVATGTRVPVPTPAVR